ncbi:hypothetical protein HHX47_DHR3001091 [Lentinula edodes]|nr:hypothetical protein HHX47_DHR3001091 [Lentinula edodes]
MSNAERVSLHLSANLSGRNSHSISVHVKSLSGRAIFFIIPVHIREQLESYGLIGLDHYHSPIAILPSQKVSNETSQSIAVELERRFISSRKVEAPSCRNLTKDDFEKRM